MTKQTKIMGSGLWLRTTPTISHNGLSSISGILICVPWHHHKMCHLQFTKTKDLYEQK